MSIEQTSQRQPVLDRIRRTGIVPVLRAPSLRDALELARAVADGGIDVLEVTMTVPGALDVIRELRTRDPGLLIGAGTVLDAETAHRCIEQGAQFIVSPATDLPTIALCHERDVAVLPGALTPTEIVTAWRAGGDVIKVFPASAMNGAAYLKSLRGPLPQVPLIPTGGVSLATAAAFLEAGAFALGVGTDLCDCAAIAAGDAAKITAMARQYLQVVAKCRAVG